MFWIALKLSIQKIGLNVMLSLTVNKLDAFKFDGVTESDNNGQAAKRNNGTPLVLYRCFAARYLKWYW